MPATAPLTLPGITIRKKGIREFIVGTGGETLDTVVYTTTLPSTDGADTGRSQRQANFNAQNIEAATGQFWGVMGLTLNPNGYTWDFESALKNPGQLTGPASFSDKGVGTCHGGHGEGGWQDGNNQGQNDNDQAQNHN